VKKFRYVFFNLDKFYPQEGKENIKKVFAVKTNEDFTILSKFEFDINEQCYHDSLYEMYAQFEQWVKNPYETKFVTFDIQELRCFIEENKKINYMPKIKDFYKIMNCQYWNIQSEIVYRMGLSNKQLFVEDLLDIYGISFVGDTSSAKDKCFNTVTLAYHFTHDTQRNKEVFVKANQFKTTMKTRENIPLLYLKRKRGSGEDMLIQKMAEGWNISIECKAKGRGYGMTLEGMAYPIDVPIEERWSHMRFGIGKTLEELLINMFEVDEEKNAYAKKKRKELETMIGLVKNEESK
jgi:hypothetical protein